MRIGFDMDGVICKEPAVVTREDCRKAEPGDLDVPSDEHEVYIVSARGESLRGVTEKWLDENGVTYVALYLYDGASKIFRGVSRRALNEIQSSYKASLIRHLGLEAFVEDRPSVRKRLEMACPNCAILSPSDANSDDFDWKECKID